MSENTERAEMTGKGMENVEGNAPATEVPKAAQHPVVPTPPATAPDEDLDSANEMDEMGEPEDMASAMEMYMDGDKSLTRGNVLHGRIVKIEGSDIYVDIGQKSEGIVAKNEFDEAFDPATIGREIDVMIVKTEDQNGNIILSKRKAEQKVAWDKIIDAHKRAGTVTAKVIKRVKGGLEAWFKGLRCFVPGSLISHRKEYNLEKYIDQEFEFRVMEFNKKRNNIILSRKQLLEEEEGEKMKKVFENIKAGDVSMGVVKSITDYGAFIDIGGIDGLLHITDMSWGHVNRPHDVVTIGAKIETKILSIDHDHKKISLGLKQLTPDPWDAIDKVFEIGMVYQGVVKNITDFGVFVTLTDGVDGLVHISDLSWTKKNPKPSEFVTVGEPINVAVLDIDKVNRRISLGLKQVTANPWDQIEELFEVGKVVEGKVKNFTQFGAFVELEHGIEGLVHISDLSWTKRINHPSEILAENDTIRVQVLSVDRVNRKVALGLKQTLENPWDRVDEKFSVGQVVEGPIVNIKKFGAFIEIEEGIEGLIHVNDLSWSDRINDPEQLVKVGDRVTVKILEINKVEKRISLGLKQMQENPWDKLKEEHPVGSTLKGRVTHFTKFGAFIEIAPGIEGLLHVTDMSWTKKIIDPTKILAENQEIELQVLLVDAANRKISLGLKQLTPNPFVALKGMMERGEVVTCIVKSTTEFGAFVELADEMEGLIHISNLSEDRVERVDDVVKIGQEVRAKIIEVNQEDRKIKLSIKAALTEGDLKDVKEMMSGAKDAGNVSLAEAFGDKLGSLVDKKDEEKKPE